MRYGVVYINRKMVAPRVLPTFEGCWEKEMTKVQREVFLIVDEWWKEFGYSPSLRDIAYQRGKTSLANTMKIVDRLVDIGVLKKMEGKGRTIRPVYINFRTLE
jgi:SOS-response transcriptional repressor LexA